MQKLHLAISTTDIAASVEEYSRRLGVKPVLVVDGEYALWRTETLNVSVRIDQDGNVPAVRHLGWEDESAQTFEAETDCNGIVWERFSAASQASEILALWPECGYKPE